MGVKGRIESNVYEKDDKKVYNKEIIAEKVTFLNSKEKSQETSEENEK